VEILLLSNAEQWMWLGTPGEGSALLEQACAGGWRPPEWISTYLCVPYELRFMARASGEVLLVFPEAPLELPPGLPPEPVEDIDLRLLSLLRRGATQRQAGVRLGRSPRWVGYRLKRLRREHGALTSQGEPAGRSRGFRTNRN